MYIHDIDISIIYNIHDIHGCPNWYVLARLFTLFKPLVYESFIRAKALIWGSPKIHSSESPRTIIKNHESYKSYMRNVTI